MAGRQSNIIAVIKQGLEGLRLHSVDMTAGFNIAKAAGTEHCSTEAEVAEHILTWTHWGNMRTTTQPCTSLAQSRHESASLLKPWSGDRNWLK